jgi:hypothetical protein
MELLDAWATWNDAEPPYVLEADRPFLHPARSRAASVCLTSWNAAYMAEDFAAPGDTRLHLGVLPQPYWGDLRRASIFVLLLNPGLGPSNYYGEYLAPPYREAVIATLRQNLSERMYPFVPLDPQFGWHGGFTWWNGKFARVIAALAEAWEVSFAAARQRLATELAVIQLVPYHSPNFHDADHWLRMLPSVALARAFVRHTVLPRVRSGDAIVIATRQTTLWDLPSRDGVVVYTAQQARAAHLTPDSPGGRAILKHLLPASATAAGMSTPP